MRTFETIKKSFMTKKHSFLLLELLVALFLLTTMLLPFAYLPIKILQKEYLSFQDLQLRRLADLRFSSIKKNLFDQKKIFLEVFSAKGAREKILLSEPSSLALKMGGSCKELTIREYAYTHLQEEGRFLIRILIEISTKNTKARKSRFIYQLVVSVRKEV